MTILVGRHFHSGMLPFERASKETWLGHIFVRNWRPNQKCTFWAVPPSPLTYSSMILVPREAQNRLQTRFFCMLIPFSMFLFESGEGKAPNSPLEARGNKVTILVGRHFHSGMLPFERASKKTWLRHIVVRNWRPNQKCTF